MGWYTNKKHGFFTMALTWLPEDLQELNCTDYTDETIIQPDYHR